MARLARADRRTTEGRSTPRCRNAVWSTCHLTFHRDDARRTHRNPCDSNTPEYDCDAGPGSTRYTRSRRPLQTNVALAAGPCQHGGDCPRRSTTAGLSRTRRSWWRHSRRDGRVGGARLLHPAWNTNVTQRTCCGSGNEHSGRIGLIGSGVPGQVIGFGEGSQGRRRGSGRWWVAEEPRVNTVMRAVLQSLVVVIGVVATASLAVGQVPVGALAVDERQGDQYGWAVDYETAAAARAAALRECGAGCSVVLTFDRCGAYAADQDADSTAVGWAEAYDSAAAAPGAAGRGASCGRGAATGRWWRKAWGSTARRGVRSSAGLQAGGFDPGGADGLFGPRTRAAIRNWQTARGSLSTGYLDGTAAQVLRAAGAAGPAVGQVVRPGPTVASAAQPPASPAGTASPLASAEFELVFWQSIANSTNPADFEAYLQQFPTGVFRALARNRLATLRGPTGAAAPVPGCVSGSPGHPGPGGRSTARRPRSAGPRPPWAGSPGRRRRAMRACDRGGVPGLRGLPGDGGGAGRFVPDGLLVGGLCRYLNAVPVHEVRVPRVSTTPWGYYDESVHFAIKP